MDQGSKPQDSPAWVLQLLDEIETKVENEMARAKTADEALKALGAFALWTHIRNEVNLESVRQAELIKEQNAAYISGRTGTA
jgi:hypothetical protein